MSIGMEERNIIVDSPVSAQEEARRTQDGRGLPRWGKGPEFERASGSVAFRATNLMNEAA